MILNKAPAQYDAKDEDQTRRALAAADKMNVKQGGPYDLKSPNGKIWRPSIDNAGTVTWAVVS